MESRLLGLTAVLVLGVASQWLAWRARIPAILVLLVAGFVAGPATGWLDPVELLGDLLLPVVSISVAVILFEGGMSLDVAELRAAGRVVRNLNTIGMGVTWVVLAVAAHGIVGLGPGLSALLGAILVVTGPTVIGPLLAHVRPSRTVGSILRWEGIVIDPIGATLAVLVFEAILAGRSAGGAVPAAVLHLAWIVLVGGGIGIVGAALLVVLLRRGLVPESMHNAVTLSAVVLVLVGCNHLAEESGLLGVTILGLVLANQRSVEVHHILEFKENLRVLLLGALFVLLAAGLDLGQLLAVGWRGLAFLGVAILVARPLAVLASTAGSGLSWPERALLAWVAPRGIVAAAVASVFALQLEAAGQAEAARLVPLVFLVIVGTVAIYGLTAAPLARRLGVALPDPQGILFVGADPWVRGLARTLADRGVRVQLVDRNRAKVRAARMEGLPSDCGDLMAETTLDELDLSGLGRMFACTPNDEVNSLLALLFSAEFGRRGVYQLAPARIEGDAKGVPARLRGRILFGEGRTYGELASRFAAGWTVKATDLTEAFDLAAYRAHWGDRSILLAVLEDGRVLVPTAGDPVEPRPGQTVVHLADDSGARVAD